MHLFTNRFRKNIFALLLALSLLIPTFVGTATAAEDLFSGAKGEACDAVGAAVTGPGGNNQCDTSDNGPLKKSEGTLSDTVTTLLNLVTMIVGIMTVLMLIISGIRFVTSSGDSNRIASAKNTLIYALVGLIIVAFAQIIVKFVLVRING